MHQKSFQMDQCAILLYFIVNFHPNVVRNCKCQSQQPDELNCRHFDIKAMTNPILFNFHRSRFLRNNDRSRNESAYPALHYPEIYLLHNGYKEFFESYPELCDPISYRQMLDPSYNEDYRHFRAKSRSWNGQGNGIARTTSNRLVKTKSRNLIY